MANHLGTADRWLAEMEAIEEADELSPFFETGFAATRALQAGFGGDLETAAAQQAVAEQSAATLESGMVNAAIDLLRGQLAFFRGDWSTAAKMALASTENVNFVLEGAIWAAFAAAAGDLREALPTVMTICRESPYQGRMTSGAAAAAGAGLAARDGRWEEVHTGYRSALDAYRECGYFVYEAMLGIEWGMLAGSRDPEALAAAEAGAQLFADRGASVVVERYRAAFVPVSGAAAAAPVADEVRSGVPSA
jgi:hypothetical protein